MDGTLILDPAPNAGFGNITRMIHESGISPTIKQYQRPRAMGFAPDYDDGALVHDDLIQRPSPRRRRQPIRWPGGGVTAQAERSRRPRLHGTSSTPALARVPDRRLIPNPVRRRSTMHNQLVLASRRDDSSTLDDILRVVELGHHSLDVATAVQLLDRSVALLIGDRSVEHFVADPRAQTLVSFIQQAWRQRDGYTASLVVQQSLALERIGLVSPTYVMEVAADAERRLRSNEFRVTEINDLLGFLERTGGGEPRTLELLGPAVSVCIEQSRRQVGGGIGDLLAGIAIRAARLGDRCGFSSSEAERFLRDVSKYCYSAMENMSGPAMVRCGFALVILRELQTQQIASATEVAYIAELARHVDASVPSLSYDELGFAALVLGTHNLGSFKQQPVFVEKAAEVVRQSEAIRLRDGTLSVLTVVQLMWFLAKLNRLEPEIRVGGEAVLRSSMEQVNLHLAALVLSAFRSARVPAGNDIAHGCIRKVEGLNMIVNARSARPLGELLVGLAGVEATAPGRHELLVTAASHAHHLAPTEFRRVVSALRGDQQALRIVRVVGDAFAGQMKALFPTEILKCLSALVDAGFAHNALVAAAALEVVKPEAAVIGVEDLAALATALMEMGPRGDNIAVSLEKMAVSTVAGWGPSKLDAVAGLLCSFASAGRFHPALFKAGANLALGNLALVEPGARRHFTFALLAWAQDSGEATAKAMSDSLKTTVSPVRVDPATKEVLSYASGVQVERMPAVVEGILVGSLAGLVRQSEG
mmetsp:Transcript_96647/g.258394  ORF Transcript_96647/g.258394 Transcript_96647/m.258394 type:complete len:760 (-) Transcript_96647:18-2297(-)